MSYCHTTLAIPLDGLVWSLHNAVVCSVRHAHQKTSTVQWQYDISCVLGSLLCTACYMYLHRILIYMW